MIEISKVQKIIEEHKFCRSPHLQESGYCFSCLVMVLAEIKGEKPEIIAKEIGVI